jgi:hypothetical protein
LELGSESASAWELESVSVSELASALGPELELGSGSASAWEQELGRGQH